MNVKLFGSLQNFEEFYTRLKTAVKSKLQWEDQIVIIQTGENNKDETFIINAYLSLFRTTLYKAINNFN